MSEKNLLTRLKKTARKYTGPALIGFTSLISVIPKIANAQEVRNKTVIYYSEETWKDSSFDFNADKKIDIVDFFMFADAYGRRDRPRFDLDHDGIVGLTELFGLADVYGMDIAIKEPTTAILNLSPDTGEAPLETRIIVGGKCDPDLNIERYRLILSDSTVVERSWPIDTTIVSEQPGNFPITGQVFDTRGTSSAKTAQIQVTPEAQESVTQEVTLENKVDINYTATLENANNTELRVLRNGQLIETRELLKGTNTESFRNLQKGTYTFTSLNDTTSVTVPNYLTRIDTIGLGLGNLELTEEATTTINLEGRILDDNPEDRPRLNAHPLDNKTTVEVTGQRVEIKGTPDSFGNFEIAVGTSTESTASATQTVSGYIHPLARIDVTTKNNETGNPEQGTFWVYDSDWNSIQTTSSDSDGSNTTNSNGRAVVKLKNIRVSQAEDLEGLIVQGGLGFPEIVNTAKNGIRTRLSEGYVRTVKNVSHGDDVLIMAVPYGRYSDRPNEFLAYVIESVGADRPIATFDFTGELVRKADPSSDYDGLKKIIILNNDPFSDASFTQEQKEHFKQRILDREDINSLTPGGNFITENMIVFGNEGLGVDYDFGTHFGRDAIFPKQGVIVITPSSWGSESYGKSLGGVLTTGGTVYLGGVTEVSTIPPHQVGPTLSHEFGHIFIGPFHPNTLYENTIMTYKSGRPKTVGPADRKLSQILNAKEFLFMPEIIASPDETFILPPRIDHIGNILNPYVGKEDAKITVWSGTEYEEDLTIHPRRTKYEK